MNINHKIQMDLTRRGNIPQIDVVQDDKYSRTIEFRLREGMMPWCPPENTAVIVRYRKQDGTCGEYDTLPDGTVAYRISGNRVCVSLAPQVLTAEGQVDFSITLVSDTRELSTFQVQIHVSGKLPLAGESEDYHNVTGFVPQPETAAVGQYLEVSGVDENGKITSVRAVEAVSGKDGVSPTVSMERFLDETGSGVRITTMDAKTVMICPVYDGEDGPAGADGKTPEKGVDYFTEADRQELVEAVLAALPDAETGSF